MPVGPYMQFSINRNASGDFKHIGVIERAKLIGQEWKALNESEKKVSTTTSSSLGSIERGMADECDRNTKISTEKTPAAM